MFKKIISLALSVVFSLQTCGFAQVAQLNLTGYLGRAAGSVSALDRFRPASLRYFSYEPKTDDFRILLDKADEKGLSDIQVKDKADELMKYFRIGLSLPNDKFWVNLRPDAPEQIIDPALEQTDIGKIMLAADLQLKKDTASWTSPRTKEGKEYWNKLYQKAGELFGSENITIPTITRPWIVPGEIIVRESGDSAYIYKAALKVMLEEDYLKSSQLSAVSSQQYNFTDPRLKELNQYSTQLIRELIIPKLTKEINWAKRYAGLRQVFYSLVLSRWFKDKFNQPQSGNELTRLIDSGNLSNLSSKEAWDKTTYFKAYQKSFKEGEYSLSESVYTPTGQVIRRYMSGGVFGLPAKATGGHQNAAGSSIVKPPNANLLDYSAKPNKIVSSVITKILTHILERVSILPKVFAGNLDDSDINALLMKYPFLNDYQSKSKAEFEKILEDKDDSDLDELSKQYDIIKLIIQQFTIYENSVGYLWNKFKDEKPVENICFMLLDIDNEKIRVVNDLLPSVWLKIMKKLLKDVGLDDISLDRIIKYGEENNAEYKINTSGTEKYFNGLSIESIYIYPGGKKDEDGYREKYDTVKCRIDIALKEHDRPDIDFVKIYYYRNGSISIYPSFKVQDMVRKYANMDTIKNAPGERTISESERFLRAVGVLWSSSNKNAPGERTISESKRFLSEIKSVLDKWYLTQLTPKERATIELNKDIVLNKEKLKRLIAMGIPFEKRDSRIDEFNKRLKKSLEDRIGEDVLANIKEKVKVVSKVFLSTSGSGRFGIWDSGTLELIAVPTEGVGSSDKHRIFLWDDARGVILDFYISVGEKILVSYASESFFEYYTDYDWRNLETRIKDALGISGASSAPEEKEILNAKKTELKGMISWLFRESEVIYNLQITVWMLRLDRSDSLSTVKKICDDIIKWIDEDKEEPKKDKKPFEAFSDSLKVIAIIGELKSLALLLEVSPLIINKALEKIETVQDESQHREILKELVNQLEAIMPAAEERLKKISAYLNKSGSPLREEMKNLLTELKQNIKEFSVNFYSLPKSNQDLPILNAQVGDIHKMIEKIRDELLYFFSPEVFLADESIEIGINFELIHDAFDRKLQEALKEGQKFSDSYQFILETKISIAGITYDSFMVYRALDGYKISFRYSDGNRDDITLYVDRDIEKTSVTVGNKAIKEELIRQIGQGSNLQYIAEPIKKALVSSAVTAAQTPKAGSALTLRDELKSALLIKQKELAAFGKIAYSPRVINPISQLIIEAISALETKGKEELNIGNIKKLIKDISAKIKKDLLQGTMDEQDQLVIIEKLNSLIEDSHILTRIFEQEKPVLTKIGGFIMENIKIIPKGNIALTPAIEISDKVTFKEIYFQHPYFAGNEVKDNVSICFYKSENQDTPSLRLTLFTDGNIDVYGEIEIMDFIYGSTLSDVYGKGDVRDFLTTISNLLKQQLTRIIIDGMRNNDYPESDAARLIKGIGEILGVEVTGMIDLVIAELSDEQAINKLKSLKKLLLAGYVSPEEPLNLKALRMLSEYLDNEMYQQVSPYISNARGIGELKEKFDNIVEALKNKAKWATAKAFNPGELNKFSYTLLVLVKLEKIDTILEERNRQIKMMAQTYASLSEKQQLNYLDVVLKDLKKAGEEIESLSLQLEEARAKIASSSLLTNADVARIINDFIRALKNQVIPNEDFLKRIELVENTEEIKWLLPGLIRSNDNLMNALEELQKQIFKLLKADYLSPAQFDEQLKDTFENVVSGKVLVIGVKSDPDLIAMVKGIKEYYAQLSEKQPDPSKTSFNPEWIDSDKGRVELIKNADVIITRWWDIADYTAKHFEFGVRLSDRNRIILKKITSSAIRAGKTSASALEEKEINAKKAELEGIIETVFEKLEKTYGLQKAVWIGLLDRSDSLSTVKKICDDIIKWIDEDKKEPKKDKKLFEAFSDSLSDIMDPVKRTKIEYENDYYPDIIMSEKAMESGINNELLDDVIENNPKKVLREGDEMLELNRFMLGGEISVLGLIYDSFLIYRPKYLSNALSQDRHIVLQEKQKPLKDKGNDIYLYIHPDFSQVVIGNNVVREELKKQLDAGNTLDYITEPIREALIKASKVSSAITNEELKKKSEEMESLRKQLSEAIKVQQEEIKQDMEIWLKERIDAVESQLRRDLLFQAQRGISDLMISITEHREVLQKLIKQAIDSSEKSQSIDMIAEYINTFQKSGERMVEAREKIYSKFPYDSSLTSDDKEKILDIIGKIKAESREYYKKLREVYASSALTALPLGGIDFRQMNMFIQPMGSFAGLDFSPVRLSSSALEAMDLDKELESITRMASGSMLPSPQRLKEYISACIFKGKVGEKADEFVLSMLEVFQLQAEEGIESSAEEREAVVMADTRRYVFEGAP